MSALQYGAVPILISLDRLQITLAKLIQELPQRKRNGSRIAGSTVSSLAFDKTKSASQAVGLLNSIEFLPEMEAEIKANPDGVISKVEALRKYRGCSSSLQEPTSAEAAVLQSWTRKLCASA